MALAEELQNKIGSTKIKSQQDMRSFRKKPSIIRSKDTEEEKKALVVKEQAEEEENEDDCKNEEEKKELPVSLSQ